MSATAGTTNPSGTQPFKTRRATLATGTALFYFTIAASNGSATITGIDGTFTLAASPASPVSIAYWTGSEWDGVSNVQGQISGTTVTFSGNDSFDPAIAANPNAYFVLYSGTQLPTSTPPPTPSPTPAATATATATAIATATPFVDTACRQTPAPSQTPGTQNVASSFFTTVQNAHTICISLWQMNDTITSSLETAAHAGASVTVITPYSEYSSNSSYLAGIVSAGGHLKYEYSNSSGNGTANATTAYQLSPMDIHAKFALIDGIAYLDGHNFYSTGDVIIQDGTTGDYSAMQSVLEDFPTPAPSNGPFTTDKYASLQAEAALITSANPGAGDTLNFISEDFEDYGPSGDAPAVYAALTAAAANGATVNVIVEGPITGSAATYENCDLSTLASTSALVHVYVGSVGSEKIAMIGPTGSAPTSAWIGSSNMTSTDLFDWGMTVSGNTNLIAAMQSYYNNALSNATSYTAGETSPACSL